MKSRPKPTRRAAPPTCRVDVSASGDTAALFEALSRFARRHGMPPRARRTMHIALDEVVTNVLRHATTTGPPLALQVTLAAVRGAFQATVTDNGRLFNPLTVPEPSIDQPLAERPIGGLGILLIRKLVDRATYARRAGRNRLSLDVRIVKRAKKTSSRT